MEVLRRLSHTENVREIKPNNSPLTYEALERRTKLSEAGKFDDKIFDDAECHTVCAKLRD